MAGHSTVAGGPQPRPAPARNITDSSLARKPTYRGSADMRR